MSTEIGVFARTFPAGPASQVAQAIAQAGFTATQLNLSVLGRPTLDADLSDQDAHGIAAAFSSAGVRVWGLSATFNAIHPDPVRRRAETAAAAALIRRAPAMGAEVATLCSGTRDADNMWRAHPANTTAAAWHDLRETLDQLLPAAAASGTRLGIEPEPGNVVFDARAAGRLLHELGGDASHVAVVLDPANLLTVETAGRQREILTAAFDQLGPQVAAVHAKDVAPSGYAAAGTGAMDYDLVMDLHAACTPLVPVIAQDLNPEDAVRVHRFLRDHASAAMTRQT